MRNVILAFSSALLLILAFPRFDLPFLAWFGLAPLLVALRGQRPALAFLLAFGCGISFLMGVFSWINAVKGFRMADFLLLGLYLASYWGAFGVAFASLGRSSWLARLLLAPAVWVSLEYLRCHAGFVGLPWALLGHSQYLNLPVIQICSITGVYGVSFLLVMANVALSEAMGSFLPQTSRHPDPQTRRPLASIATTLGLVGLTLGYGYHALASPPGAPGFRVSLIQANISQAIMWKGEHQKANLEKHLDLSRLAIRSWHPELIVWPESAVPGVLLHNPSAFGAITALARETEVPLLIGSSIRPKFEKGGNPGNLYNTVLLISPQGAIVNQYHKIKLIPFGEYLPYRGRFPWPRRMAALATDFAPGQKYTIFQANGVRFGVLICWESIFPEVFRQFVQEGAAFMVNATNEAWFDGTAVPHQILAINVFRAVENRVSLARAANTGVSCFIDPRGRILDRVANGGQDVGVEGYLNREVELTREKSFYTRYGEVFAFSNLGLTGCWLLLTFLKKGA